ncbi:PKD domain-containing protein [Candidatus Bipolaricaulota bacterium]|nr:PKD domain-containing protein [Candidatus Bipolaricaulota bacterium]
MKKSKLALLALLTISLALFVFGCGFFNQGPNASFTADPTSGEAPLGVYFDASASSNPDGEIVSHSWDFDDGESGFGEKPDHVYSSSVDYTVELTVTDTDGDQDSTSKTISVSPGDGEKRVEILDWERKTDDDGHVLITGTAKNISNETLAAAIVEGKLFNANDDRVGTAMYAITFLDPGETWAFEAESIINDDEVDYVEMVTDSSVYQSP